MKKWKSLSFVGLSCLTLSASLIACGKEEKTEAKIDTSEITPYGKFKETKSFTTGLPKEATAGLLKGDTRSSNSYTRYLKEHSNVEAKIAWESADFNQKVSLAVSSGDIPDVMVVAQEQYQQLLNNDLIMDITDLYDKGASDNLKNFIKSYDQDLLEATSDDGKLMAIPAPYPSYEENLVWIRKDWLDKVNLPVPETMEELSAAAKKFVDQDVSGTGNTLGLTFHPELTGQVGGQSDAGAIFSQYGSFPKSWIEKDGKVVYGSTQPETKEVLQMLASWYKEGIIDPEFVTRTEDDRMSAPADRLGIYFGPFWAAQDLSSTYEKDKNAEWIAVLPTKEKGDKFISLTPQPINRYVVISKKCKNPDAVMRAINDIVDFSNSLGDAEAFREKEAEKAGIESLTVPWYLAPIWLNINSSQKNITESEKLTKALDENDRDAVPNYLLGYYDTMKKFEAGETTDAERYLEYTQGIPAITNKDKVEFVNKAYYGKTSSMAKMNSNLLKLEDETFIKIIMGEAPIDEFDTFVEQFNKQGGSQIQKEVQEMVDDGKIQ